MVYSHVLTAVVYSHVLTAVVTCTCCGLLVVGINKDVWMETILFLVLVSNGIGRKQGRTEKARWGTAENVYKRQCSTVQFE